MPKSKTSLSINIYFLIVTQNSLHSGTHLYFKQAIQKYGEKSDTETL
jgi:hypothetical protein